MNYVQLHYEQKPPGDNIPSSEKNKFFDNPNELAYTPVGENATSGGADMNYVQLHYENPNPAPVNRRGGPIAALMQGEKPIENYVQLHYENPNLPKSMKYTNTMDTYPIDTMSINTRHG